MISKSKPKNKVSSNCHGQKTIISDPALPKIVLVGNPNVGKSVLFNYFTGTYATVSNYPGTTVSVFKGKTQIDNINFEVIDTPGMYSLKAITEEERVARRIIFNDKPDIVIHVIDAKNMQRMLLLTFQLIEAGLPLILQLNIMDEARDRGIEINLTKISSQLGVPVVGTVSTTGEGLEELKKKIIEKCQQTTLCK